MAKLIVFDCDGTLVDSQATIVACAQAAFSACDVEPPSDHDVRQIVGLSLEPAMRQLLGRDDPVMSHRIADAYRDAFVAYRQQPDFDEPLFAGVKQLLRDLHRNDILMGVATGKAMRGLVHVIEHHQLHGFFVTLQTADLHPSKPHPSMMEAAMRETDMDPDDTVIVGDTTFDIEMGLAAGCRAVGVSYGNHAPELLHAAGATHVIDGISQLPEILNIPLR